jgi:hypothetical protein
MAELIVVGFKKDMSRASEVLNTLMEMNTNWSSNVVNGPRTAAALVVYPP